MDGHPVDVEVAISQGLPVFTIVGLPDPSIQEARERVRAAIQSSSETWPLKRVTVNLSPAHLRKAGSSFDLAMAPGVPAAEGRFAPEPLRPICGGRQDDARAPAARHPAADDRARVLRG